MEEKVLIKSEQYNVKKAFMIMIIIGAILSVIMFFSVISSQMRNYEYYYTMYLKHQKDGRCGRYYSSYDQCSFCETIEKNPTKLGYALTETFVGLTNHSPSVVFWLTPVATFALIGGLIYLCLRSYELTVTDKRIYGKVAWGKRVDLPVDSISATATIRVLKGVSVSTPSGRISFRVIKNADEIYEVVNSLLIERQQKKVNATAAATAPKSDEADQLKKYKDLLDSGAITQEEFDAKKKQLLGL